jgi:hypothetical protein
MMSFSSDHRALLHRCGAVILFVGICLGALIYWSAPQGANVETAQSGYDDSPLSPDDSRRYAHDTEVNLGKVGALTDKWTRMAAHWGEPKPLAITILVVSALLAGGCFLAGRQRHAALSYRARSGTK